MYDQTFRSTLTELDGCSRWRAKQYTECNKRVSLECFWT